MVKGNHQDGQMTIGLAGDVMLGRLVGKHLEQATPASVWGNLLSLLHQTDLNLINLETALTKSENIVPKVFNFRSDPKNVQALVEGSIDVVNLANNHVLDYSKEGLIETLEVLEKAQIQYVGAGRNASEATSPLILIRRGIKVGIVGCTDNEPTWKATDQRPGTRYIKIGDLNTIQGDIIQLRRQVDLLILSIHWGPNMQERPSSHFIAFAHQLIEMGVDIIHGHSAHIFQGVEVYKGKLILYDTGDFVDDYYVDPVLRNDRSFFFMIEVDKQGLRTLRLIPVIISHFQVNRAIAKDEEEMIDRMQVLSKELHTSLTIEKGVFTKHQLYASFTR